MAGGSSQTGAGELLVTLRDEMNEARAAVTACRRPPVDPGRLVAARRQYLAAMLAYEQALTSLRLPVPPRLRDELRLMRRVVPETTGTRPLRRLSS